jgi:L-asparaginase
MHTLTVTLIATGGTIAKSYHNNGIANVSLMIDKMVSALRLPDLTLRFVDLMRIDSLEMNDSHRASIADEAIAASLEGQAVIITHGTDTLLDTGKMLHQRYCDVPMPHPVVLTGAMLPYVMQGSDALQNLTEALLAVRILPPAVYVALHNRILPLPRVQKNHQRGTFEAI